MASVESRISIARSPEGRERPRSSVAIRQATARATRLTKGVAGSEARPATVVHDSSRSFAGLRRPDLTHPLILPLC